MRLLLLLALLFAPFLPVFADDILFIGNSLTFGGSVPVLPPNGGVPKLVQEIARARGRQLNAQSVTHPGAAFSYHLAQPATAKALNSKVWTWVVLQDFSLCPTHIGGKEFSQGGEAFSQRIAEHSPRAGIILYETWADPAGSFYRSQPGTNFSGPSQMLAELHQNYAQLRDDLAARNTHRPVRIAPVGDAFALCQRQYPAINLSALDHPHASPAGYYLAALVIYATIYHASTNGAPASFFHDTLVIPPVTAAKLQHIADKICGLL